MSGYIVVWNYQSAVTADVFQNHPGEKFLTTSVRNSNAITGATLYESEEPQEWVGQTIDGLWPAAGKPKARACPLLSVVKSVQGEIVVEIPNIYLHHARVIPLQRRRGQGGECE